MLLSDDFSDPARARVPTQSTVPTSYTLAYAGGEYQLRIDPSYRFIPLIRPDGQYGDSSIQIDARILGSLQDRYVAVGCRDTLLNEGSNEYRLSFYPVDGQFRLSRWDKGVETILARRVAPSAKVGNEMNRLALRCAGTAITAWINDVEVASVEDSTHQQGWMWFSAGLVGSATPAVVEARFDNLFIREANP